MQSADHIGDAISPCCVGCMGELADGEREEDGEDLALAGPRNLIGCGWPLSPRVDSEGAGEYSMSPAASAASVLHETETVGIVILVGWK